MWFDDVRKSAGSVPTFDSGAQPTPGLGSLTQPPGLQSPTASQTYANGLLNQDQYQQLINAIEEGYGPGSAQQSAPGTMGKTYLNYWLDTIAGEGLTPERGLDYWLNRARGAGAGPGDVAKFGPYAGQVGDTGGLMGSSYGNLSSLGLGAGSAVTPFTGQFSAPTAQQALDSPGLQFAMSEAQKAIQRSAAARGTLLTGGTLKDLAGYTTGMALQGYGDVYNRASSEFDRNRNIFESNQDRPFEKFYSLAALGKP